MTPSFEGVSRRRRYTLVATLLASTMLGGGLVYANTATPQATAPLQLPPVASQAGFSELATKVKPAVVNIATSEKSRQTREQDVPDALRDSPLPDMFRHHFDQHNAAPEHALGSGFIIDPAGYIVTNNHVVDGARKIDVTLDDGSTHSAKVVGRDAKTGLARLMHQGPERA